MKNRYAIRSRISEAEFRQLVRLFALDLEATQITVLTGLNRNTINRYLRGIRQRIAEYCEAQSPFSGEVEVGYGKHLRVDLGRDDFAGEEPISTGLKASGAFPNHVSRDFVA